MQNILFVSEKNKHFSSNMTPLHCFYSKRFSNKGGYIFFYERGSSVKKKNHEHFLGNNRDLVAPEQFPVKFCFSILKHS